MLSFSPDSLSKAKKGIGRLLGWRPGNFAVSSVEMLFWLALRSGVLVVIIILMTRSLIAEDYGYFVTVLAIAGFFSPLAGLGLQGVILRDVARDSKKLPLLLAPALKAWFISSLVFGVVGGMVANIAIPRHGISTWIVIVFVLGEVASGSGVDLLARTEQALHRTRAYGVYLTGLALTRFLVLLVCAWFSPESAASWMLAYAISGLGYMFALVVRTKPSVRGVSCSVGLDFVRSGLPFAVGSLSLRLQSEFNKPALAHIEFSVAGFFNIAQRVVDMASLPLSAMIDAVVARVYADSNPQSRLRVMRVVLLICALCCGALLWLLAPFLPLIVGESYASTVSIVRYLAWLPVLQVLRNLGNIDLVAHGQAGRLTWVYVVGTTFSVVVTMLLVDRFGVMGAVVATYLTELVFILVQFFARRGREVVRV